jgi:hypothetical protein
MRHGQNDLVGIPIAEKIHKKTEAHGYPQNTHILEVIRKRPAKTDYQNKKERQIKPSLPNI